MNAGDFRQDRGGYPLEPSTATHTSEYEISCRPRGVASERALAALVRIGWTVTWQSGSHRRLKRLGLPNYTFASHARRKMGQSPRWRLPAKWNGELQGRPGCRRIPPVKRRSRQLEQLAVRLDEKSPTRGSARPPADIR